MAWTYSLVLKPAQPGHWDALWVATSQLGHRNLWDAWQLSAQPGARTASAIASDTWQAATELLERQVTA